MTHGAPAKKSAQQSDEPAVKPPDGGWGWMVVFGSVMIHIIADGITYNMGIFLSEWLVFYNQGSGSTSWVLSILVGVTLGSGPIAGSLVNKYGCRPVTILGCLIAGVGFFFSIFAPNVITLYITVGLIGGFGFGLMYLPAIVSVTCYFEKYRSFATGIAVCGSGLGTFIFSPAIEALIQEYAWKGALMIISAIILNCMIFGALFRPLEAPKTQKVSPESVEAHPAEMEKLVLPEANGNKPPSQRNSANLTVPEENYARTSVVGGVKVMPDASGEMRNSRVLARSQPQLLEVPNPANGTQRMFGSHGALPEERRTSQGGGPSQSQASSRKSSTQEVNAAGIMYRKDILYSGSLLNIPEYKSNPKLYSGSVNRIPETVEQEELSGETKNTVCGCIPCSPAAYHAYKEMVDLSLMKDPVFILFVVSNFCTSIGFNVPYVFIKDKASKLGIASEDASFLLAVIGIANTVGRIILGYISDKPWVNRLWLYNIALTICGIATALSAFCLDYTSMIVYASVFGATAGAYVGLTSVVLVDLLGLDRLTNAFGVLLLFQGVASLIGPPIAGWLYDAYKSYDPGFYTAGAMIAASGLMLFVIPLLQRHVTNKQHKQAEKSTEMRAVESC